MSTLRFHALKTSMNRATVSVQENSKRSEVFGSNVFGISAMRSSLPKVTFTN